MSNQNQNSAQSRRDFLIQTSSTVAAVAAVATDAAVASMVRSGRIAANEAAGFTAKVGAIGLTP